MPLIILKDTGQVFVRCPLIWEFSYDWAKIMGFPGRKLTEAKCQFHDVAKVHIVNVIITVELDLDHLAEGASGRL